MAETAASGAEGEHRARGPSLPAVTPRREELPAAVQHLDPQVVFAG